MAIATTKPHDAPENPAAPCGRGCYRELSPREFDRHKEMVVVLLKSEHALAEFTGFRALIYAPTGHEAEAHLGALAKGQAIGVVCPDGDCSGRLAIRLSNQGYPVYHLAGGLREWYHSFRDVRAATA